MDDYSNITVLEKPIEVDTGKWAVEHPDCDTIFENVDQGQHMRVFAYSKGENGNKDLKIYRDTFLSGLAIQKGLSRYAIAGLV